MVQFFLVSFLTPIDDKETGDFDKIYLKPDRISSCEYCCAVYNEHIIG